MGDGYYRRLDGDSLIVISISTSEKVGGDMVHQENSTNHFLFKLHPSAIFLQCPGPKLRPFPSSPASFFILTCILSVDYRALKIERGDSDSALVRGRRMYIRKISHRSQPLLSPSPSIEMKNNKIWLSLDSERYISKSRS